MTDSVAAPNKSCNMVLLCHFRVWPRIVIQQQHTRFEKPRPLFPNRLFQFRQGLTVPNSIDGSNVQKVHAKVNASSVCKALSFPAGVFEAYQAYMMVICVQPHILEFFQSSKNIINTDLDGEKAMNNAAPTSSEMRNITYLDAHSKVETNNKMDDIE
ncbi:hypothetical protein TNCV_4121631 [Trichonephila clavipes]|nr:hypothetical protein TNCV_4121631 [Trichonephila clavipes]